MQISTSVLPTLSAAVCSNTVGSYACTCKGGFTGDGKTCSGKLSRCCKKRFQKQCACPYFLYSIFTFKHVENDEHMTSMVRDNNNLIKVILEICVSRKISLKLVLQNCQAQPVTNWLGDKPLIYRKTCDSFLSRLLFCFIVLFDFKCVESTRCEFLV